jgi:hypothetical protein
MIDHLLAIKEAVATAGAAGLLALPPADQERFLKGYERIVQAAHSGRVPAPPEKRFLISLMARVRPSMRSRRGRAPRRDRNTAAAGAGQPAHGDRP